MRLCNSSRFVCSLSSSCVYHVLRCLLPRTTIETALSSDFFRVLWSVSTTLSTLVVLVSWEKSSPFFLILCWNFFQSALWHAWNAFSDGGMPVIEDIDIA